MFTLPVCMHRYVYTCLHTHRHTHTKNQWKIKNTFFYLFHYGILFDLVQFWFFFNVRYWYAVQADLELLGLNNLQQVEAQASCTMAGFVSDLNNKIQPGQVAYAEMTALRSLRKKGHKFKSTCTLQSVLLPQLHNQTQKFQF